MPDRIVNYKQAYELLGLHLMKPIKYPYEYFILRMKLLEADGRSEKSICFAIWRSQEKICQFKGDGRFYGILENEIKKWSWAKDDPRWKLKKQIEEAEKSAKELKYQFQRCHFSVGGKRGVL